jgi:hypothetical protein
VERVGPALEIHPVAGGVVGDQPSLVTDDALEPAVAGLAWPPADGARDDTPWLNAWRHSRRTGVEVRVSAGEAPGAVAARIRGALAVTRAP